METPLLVRRLSLLSLLSLVVAGVFVVGVSIAQLTWISVITCPLFALPVKGTKVLAVACFLESLSYLDPVFPRQP
jgi:hypothetical protein